MADKQVLTDDEIRMTLHSSFEGWCDESFVLMSDIIDYTRDIERRILEKMEEEKDA